MTRRLPSVRRRRTPLLAAIVIAGLLWTPLAAAQVADGGFESGVLLGPDLPPMDPSFAVWTRRDDNARLAQAPEPVHAGARSAAVDTRASAVGSFIIQDFDSGSLSYRWTFWTYPVEGQESAGLHYNWDRGVAGNLERGTTVVILPNATVVGGWDAVVWFAPIPYGAWHEIRVVADRCTRTQELLVDGISWGTVAATPSAVLPAGIATMFFGDTYFQARHAFFYYDDVSVELFDCANPQPAPCPRSQGFWKNHAARWPVESLDLGTETYTKAELLALLRTPPRGDASVILAHQLVAAKLNVANGSDATPIVVALADADALLSAHPGKLPYRVRSSTAEGQSMAGVAQTLDDYNNRLFTPSCEDMDDSSGAVPLLREVRPPPRRLRPTR